MLFFKEMVFLIFQMKMNNLFESVQRLENSNKQLWNKVTNWSGNVNEDIIKDNTFSSIDRRKSSFRSQTQLYYKTASVCEKREEMIIPCLQFNQTFSSKPTPYITKISKVEYENPTTDRLSPSLLETNKYIFVVFFIIFSYLAHILCYNSRLLVQFFSISYGIS